MTLFGMFDFETDSPKPETARVVQVAFVAWEIDDEQVTERKAEQVLCYVPSIPIGATAVHGITPASVADRKDFSEQVGAVARLLARCEYVVTFNGACYDVPILERYAAAVGVDVGFVRARHIDCYRAWRRRQAVDRRAACYSGGLSGAHLFYTNDVFDGAHDATVDCRATGQVLRAQLRDHALVDLVRWSSLPLPGYADMEGKLKWIGDVLTLGFSEHAGHDVADVDAGFLRWMLGKDFPDDVKAIVRLVLDGGYPARRYEDEV